VKGFLGQVLVDAREEGEGLRKGGREGGKEGERERGSVRISLGRVLLMLVRRVRI